jgi:hypothetical protein
LRLRTGGQPLCAAEFGPAMAAFQIGHEADIAESTESDPEPTLAGL